MGDKTVGTVNKSPRQCIRVSHGTNTYLARFRGFPSPYSMNAWWNRRAGAPTRAIQALPSTFFSLLPTLETHCKVSTHYLLLSSPFSLLWLPTAKCPRTTFSFLLPSPYFGSPLHSDHALPSPFFSLLPTVEAHCIVATHYLLLSSPYSLLSCPLVSISGSLILRGRVAEPPRGRAQARHPRTTFSFLLPSPYFGSPLQSDHALPSPFFSLFPTFVSIRVH